MTTATTAAEQTREYARLLNTPVTDCLERFGWVQIRRGVWTLDAHRRLWTLDETARTLVVKHRQPNGWGRPISLLYPQNAAELVRAAIAPSAPQLPGAGRGYAAANASNEYRQASSAAIVQPGAAAGQSTTQAVEAIAKPLPASSSPTPHTTAAVARKLPPFS